MHNPIAVAVEGVNVGTVQAKVTGEGENVGIGEGGEGVAVLDEGIAGGGGVGGGGVLHFLVPLFVFVFALSLEDTINIPQPNSDVKLKNCKVGTKITTKTNCKEYVKQCLVS